MERMLCLMYYLMFNTISNYLQSTSMEVLIKIVEDINLKWGGKQLKF